jgi:hypothetical protein
MKQILFCFLAASVALAGSDQHLTQQEVGAAEQISAAAQESGSNKEFADYLTAFAYAQSAFNANLVTEWGKNAITINGVRYETEPPRNKSLVEEFRKGQKVDGLSQGIIWKTMMASGYRYMFQQNGDDPSQWTHDRQWVAEEKNGQWTRWQKMRDPVKGKVIWMAHSLPYTN